MDEEIKKLIEENQTLSEKLKIAEIKVNVITSIIKENIEEYHQNITELEKISSDNYNATPELNNLNQSLNIFLQSVRKMKFDFDEKNKLFESTIRKLENLYIQLSEADKSKSEFIANTSHELRTPLNAIMGYLELILEGLYDSPEEMKEFLNGALKSAGHLLKLLNDILDIARIESGKLRIHFGEVNIKSLLDSVYSSYSNQAVQRGIKLIMELPEENIKVRGDFEKIKQIFHNLLSNAFKFTPKNGVVTIKAQEVLSKDHVLCEVIDTGIGISSENHKKIFERFFQVDGSTTREYGGAGLGLSITKCLVELMGGLVSVSSEGKDHGSRFFFTLPVYHIDKEFDLNERSFEKEIKISGSKNNPLILIVEDDYNYRQYLSSLLVHNSYSTIGSSTADDGLARIKEFKPDLLILDYALPRREMSDLHNGMDLYRLLLDHPDFGSLPIIMISGHPLNLIRMFHEGFNIDFENFFEKPVDSNLLLQKISNLLKKDG